MEVRVNVNENDIIRVTVGDTTIIDVDSYSYMDKEFKGVVTAIANSANDVTSADVVTEFEVKILVLNDSYRDLIQEVPNQSPFRPGMTASVDIITDKKVNVLSVPLASVTTRDSSRPKGARAGKRNNSAQQKPKARNYTKEGSKRGGICGRRWQGENG